ncbi:MAG: aminotransferase class IV [Motiliproteus sp.]
MPASSAPSPIVYLNGSFMPMELASVPVMDRGFLFGDSVYEVIPFYHGVGFRLQQHLRRLRHSLDAAAITIDRNWPVIFSELIDKNPASHQAIYLQVSRGVMPQRSLNYDEAIEPTVFAYSYPIDMALDRPLEQVVGVSAVTVPDQRWKRCDIKATGLMANVLAARDAVRQGAQEALQVRDGYLSEGVSCNLFLVERGVIHTPPMGGDILGGTTRELILKLAADASIECVEAPIRQQRLAVADEVWVSSSSRGVVPVICVNGTDVADGLPGPVWRQIAQSFRQFGRQLLAEHQVIADADSDAADGP